MSNRRPGPLELPENYARTLAWYQHVIAHRIRGRYDPELASEPREPRVHLERVEYVEQKVGARIPDFVLGWYAAGFASEGKWGASQIPDIGYVAGLHDELQGRFDDHEETGRQVSFGRGEFVPFDYDNANYFLFSTSDPDNAGAWFLDHETLLSEPPFGFDLIENLRNWAKEMVDNDDDYPMVSEFEPMVPVLYSEPLDIPEPAVDDAIGHTVTHPKFGPGTIVKRLGSDPDKFLVDFEDGGRRKLLARFLDFG